MLSGSGGLKGPNAIYPAELSAFNAPFFIVIVKGGLSKSDIVVVNPHDITRPPLTAAEGDFQGGESMLDVPDLEPVGVETCVQIQRRRKEALSVRREQGFAENSRQSIRANDLISLALVKLNEHHREIRRSEFPFVEVTYVAIAFAQVVLKYAVAGGCMKAENATGPADTATTGCDGLDFLLVRNLAE